jgi:hypothetical protein
MTIFAGLTTYCREGWLTGCLTVLETIWVITSIVLAVFVRQVAIVLAFVICFAAGYNIKKRFIDKNVEDTSAHPAYDTMKEENQNAGLGVTTDSLNV